MAVLSDSDRLDVWAAFMRTNRSTIAATKPQLRAAVNAADGWCESTLADYQAAIPEPVRAVGNAETLRANAASIAAGGSVNDVADGIATRDQSSVLLAAYNAASSWLTAQIGGYLTAVGVACEGALTVAQMLAILEAVCRRRAA